MCIDFVAIRFGIASGQISSLLDRVICPQHIPISFQDNNLSKSQWIFTKLDMYIDIMAIWVGIANGQISVHDMIMAGYYRLTFLFIP